MVECKECQNYANVILERGEITADEINKLIFDRHNLKGCEKKSSPFLGWLEVAIENQKKMDRLSTPFPLPSWNKGYLEALLDCKDKYTDNFAHEIKS